MTKKKSTRPADQRMCKDGRRQMDMFEKSLEEELEAKKQEPVTCLGIEFENDQTRREHFLCLLREGLEELHEKHNKGK